MSKLTPPMLTRFGQMMSSLEERLVEACQLNTARKTIAKTLQLMTWHRRLLSLLLKLPTTAILSQLERQVRKSTTM